MINKKKIKQFNENGFIIIKNLLKKKDINNIFFQLDEVLTTILEYKKIKYNKNASVDKKYLLLQKYEPVLKSHFYNSISILDSLNSIVFSKDILITIKKLLNRKTIFVRGQRLRLDHKDDPHNLPLHQELGNISNDLAVLWCPLIKMKKCPLCVIPGSHKDGHLIYKDSDVPAENHKVGIVEKILKDKENKDYKNQKVKKLFNKKNLFFPILNPGDGLIFKTFLFHGSLPYKGKGLRWSFLSSFHPIDKTPYLVNQNYKKMFIPYSANYNKIFNKN